MKKTVLSLRFDHSVAYLTISEFVKKKKHLLEAFTFNLSEPFALEFLDENSTTLISEVGQNISEFVQNVDEMHISYSMQSSLLKSVIADEISDDNLINEQIKWEFSQITKVPITDFVINLPTHPIKHHHVFVAMRKKLVEFSHQLSEDIQIPLTKIGLNLTNLTQIVKDQYDYDEHENYLVINRGRILTEVGAFFNGMFQRTHLISKQETSNVNQINLQLRNILDIYKSAYNEIFFHKIYICGSSTETSEAELIANVLQIPVTILQIPSYFTYAELISDIENDKNKQSEYIINIASMLD